MNQILGTGAVVADLLYPLAAEPRWDDKLAGRVALLYQ